MNIFIMILVVMFMGVYYIMAAPSQRTIAQETDYAIEQADLRSVVECTSAVHVGQINNVPFEDICVSQNGIRSKTICMNDKMAETKCEIIRGKKPAYTFIVTATSPIPANKYNNIMEILEKNYADAGMLGMFNNGFVLTGGDTIKHTVPKPIITSMDLVDGSLVYMTQYEMPDSLTEFTPAVADNVVCPGGTTKVYKFGRWQCIPYNPQTNCSGDTVWDSDLMECVADETRKPLCAGNQTAVLVDSVWECVDPFPDVQCPNGYTTRLNYDSFEWECVVNPNRSNDIKKCDNVINYALRNPLGTQRNIQTSCTDCEKMVTDVDTCESHCVPDVEQIGNPACYSGTCNGVNRGFYFGFPSLQYATRVTEVEKMPLVFDTTHSQNRRFNCMDCTNRGGINYERSMPPFITVCNEN